VVPSFLEKREPEQLPGPLRKTQRELVSARAGPKWKRRRELLDSMATEQTRMMTVGMI
jgi:hypothetical protein